MSTNGPPKAKVDSAPPKVKASRTGAKVDSQAAATYPRRGEPVKPKPAPTNGSPDKVTVVPRHAARFSSVSALMVKGNDAAAFRRAAEICVDKAEVLAPQMGGLYPTLKLAIELHKHSLFVAVAQDKSKTQYDAAAYEAYQKYLAGETSAPVAIGLPSGTVPDDAPPVDADEDEEKDDA